MGPGLKQKDLCGIPWRVALALQADGWYLRSDIIWAKPNPMPESVTDRPTKAHEYLFLLTKSARYFYDAGAVREPWTSGRDDMRKHGVRTGVAYIQQGVSRSNHDHGTREAERHAHEYNGGRNARTVWTIATQSYSEAHFATFPEELPRRCIKAGTSERGTCPSCGSQWVRVVESDRVPTRPGDKTKCSLTGGAYSPPGQSPHSNARKKEGNRDPQRHISVKRGERWEPGCDCGESVTVPATVLDPFLGSGTTIAVALQLGRRGIGIEINPEYAKLAERRIGKSTRPHSFRDESVIGDAPLFIGKESA